LYQFGIVLVDQAMLAGHNGGDDRDTGDGPHSGAYLSCYCCSGVNRGDSAGVYFGIGR
jgi:hypothetical protein